MKTFRFAINVLAVSVFLLALASLAHAQNRSWVSSGGDDAAPCSRSAPCKTFAGAYGKTDEGGEIDVVDPGGYGTLSISKAITIDGGAGWGSIVVTGGGDGIVVNVTSGISGPAVILRNLSFNGVIQTSGTHGANGINFLKADRLYVENCVFENFTTSGINMSLTDNGSLWVNDCRFDKTTNGIVSTATTGFFATVNIDHTRFNGMTNGVKTITNSFVTMRDSYFGGITGTTYGAVAVQPSSVVFAENCLFSNNAVGVNILGGVARLSNNCFFSNTAAISGTAESANNNKFSGNASDGSTTNTIVVK